MKKMRVYCPFALQGFSAGMFVVLGVVTPTLGYRVALIVVSIISLGLSIWNEHKMRKQDIPAPTA